MNKTFQRLVAHSARWPQYFRARRLVAVAGLFFINQYIFYPTPASAALFSWNKDNRPAVVALGSKSASSWSFDSSWVSGSQELDTTPIELMLGADLMLRTKNTSKTIVSVGLTYVVEASGYSSTVDQTDDSPFITAKGTRVRPGIIAANFLPFGTVIRIPEIYGNRTFVVEDRMNTRYQNHIDIWFSERSTALQFGRKKVVIEIVSS
jgi:3D (Asp-Asp-Asp) domain-containing protein